MNVPRVLLRTCYVVSVGIVVLTVPVVIISYRASQLSTLQLYFWSRRIFDTNLLFFIVGLVVLLFLATKLLSDRLIARRGPVPRQLRVMPRWSSATMLVCFVLLAVTALQGFSFVRPSGVGSQWVTSGFARPSPVSETIARIYMLRALRSLALTVLIMTMIIIHGCRASLRMLAMPTQPQLKEAGANSQI